jgi:cytochrome c553
VPATAQEDRARELFLANCATCHGEQGDGQGTTELLRPARSFQDGGFSYGNTPEALFRTISIGIPGTEMPGFDTSLSEEERRLLAGYVVTLGPEIREVTTEETVMVVRDRPQVVRGMLPPVDPGAVSHPRGLLIGTTSGLTFEYRVDDVRLLGVRQGGFVERTDWTGRGGSALRPIGLVVHLVERGLPEPPFRFGTRSGPKEPLRASLERTWIASEDVGLDYRLTDSDGRLIVRVRESVDALRTRIGAGFRRRLAFSDATHTGSLRMQLPRAGDDEELDSFLHLDPSGVFNERSWTVVARPGGTVECVGVVVRKGNVEGLRGEVDLRLERDARPVLHVVTVVAAEWTDKIRAGLGEIAFP